jgi:serine/threonine-protein kinase RsbW
MSPVSAFVAEAARRRGLDGASTSVLELAVYEACVNVIEHGYHFDAMRRFRLDLLEEDDRLTFQIVSGGEPFDLHQAAAGMNSAGRAPVTHRLGRGLGVPIIMRAMDEVFCERGPDGSNRLVLVKRLREATVRA